MENIGTQIDEAYETIKDINEKDNELMSGVLEKLMDILGEELKADNDFGVKHGYLAVGKLLIYLSQSLCKDEEMFKDELDKAQNVAIDRIITSILPNIENDKIVEEGYDLENLSIRRIMMALGTAVDYVLWRTELSNYQQIREQQEAAEKALKDQEQTESETIGEEE